MNYLETYYSRVNHMGNTIGERVINNGIRTFQRWKNESPHTVSTLSVERGLYFDGIILTSKDKTYQKIMQLHVSNDTPIKVGDIMNWRQSDGEIEKWILLSEEKKVNGTYRSFDILKCNYLVKWVDAAGHLQSSWSYVLSSTDDKIKGNYRTWHNLISPQPNKYAEIIMPRREVDRGTNFIIEDEGWQLIEYDHTSVAGIIYLSLTENKVNLIYDDLDEDIADTDKLAQYRIDLPPLTQHFSIGQEIAPVFTIFKNGLPIELELKWKSDNKAVVRIIDNKPTAVGEGEVTIIPYLDDPQIEFSGISIIVDGAETEFSAYLEGNDSIRLDRYCTYTFVGSSAIDGEVTFSLAETELASIVKVTETTCTIHANTKNKLGEITLIAAYNGIEYTKLIKVVPLW